MAQETVARAKSLSWTKVGGVGPTGPLTKIQSYATSRPEELAAFLLGTARVEGHYKGKKSGSIRVMTSDMTIHSAFAVGQKFTNVTLTIEGAVDSAGTAVGSDVVVVLSEAVVTEVGDLEDGNENSAPVVAGITFTLSRFATSTNDPTMTIT